MLLLLCVMGMSYLRNDVMSQDQSTCFSYEPLLRSLKMSIMEVFSHRAANAHLKVGGEAP